MSGTHSTTSPDPVHDTYEPTRPRGGGDAGGKAPLNPLVVMLAVALALMLLALVTAVGVAMSYRGRAVETAQERNQVVSQANSVIDEVKTQRDDAVGAREALLEQVTTCQVLLKVNKHLDASVDASIEGIEASTQGNQKWLAGRMREVQRQLRRAERASTEAGFENSQDLALACAGEEAKTS